MAQNKKSKRVSLGQLIEQANKDGFGNITDWQKWRRDQQVWKEEQKWYKKLENIYGKEFSDLARHNKDIPKKYLNIGCKSEKEYRDKVAQKLGFIDRIEHNNYKAKINGFKDDAERVKISRWERGICFPMSDDADLSQYLGIYLAERKYAKNILPIILGDIKKEMPQNYPGYDFIVGKGIKVDIKARRLSDKYNHWNFPINHNDKTDYFLFIGFNNGIYEDELEILHIWLIRCDDMVIKCSGNGQKLDILYNREGIAISNDFNSPMYFAYFDKYEQINNPKIRECLKNINKGKL